MIRWRDDVAAPSIERRQPAVRVARYTAFNVNQSAIVAELSGAGSADDLPSAPKGIESSVLFAHKISEFRQPSLHADASPSILYSVVFDIPQEWHEEFNAWYDQEHMPMIFECREWLRTMRYRVEGSTKATHLALHYIQDPSAFDSPPLKAARLTPWRNALVKHRWFTDVEKMIYYRQG
ncbi:DUF4286 family protein [Ancylobacter polymorphus]|uniref:Uncharacterized protein n=1 Tax=Ancylobacter polymorphus TaxID=223390 RepID=A0A9E7A0D6_9HYPH|nr:DUF4286 family protein [Ancylobacter polymorphus]UOK73307.1 hypothetical protein K9D25_21930 [Ancylobacter polymorphus]